LSDSTNDCRSPLQAKTAGAYALSEILSQPQCWSACLKLLDEKGSLKEISKTFGAANDWLFVGCGSSYYVALSAAAGWSLLTGTRARAIPASELLLFPEQVLADSRKVVSVLISRSGRTSEVLKAAELLRARGFASLAITCAQWQPLEKLVSRTVCLAPADEQSTVMTRSFTSQLLALQYLAANIAGDDGFEAALRRLPPIAAGLLDSLPKRVREFAASYRFANYVALGQGPFFGLACEAALKVTEMSVSYAQSFHTLEFRHGPKSVVSPETLLMFLLSETGYEAESAVLEEVKKLGGTTLVIANKADKRARASADFLIELDSDLPELTRLAPYAFGAQLLGLYTGLKRGLDPDRPRNLSRVVLLDEDKSSETTEHAAL
jgi:glucosamine--fructose-6-phosphate aminotransferase (isomerizing)